MTRAFGIIAAAFGHNPYMDGLYPAHNTPQGRSAGGERMLAFKKNDPDTYFLKATDTESEEIVGIAKWNIYNGTIPEEVGLDGEYWETEEDKEYANCLWAAYLVPRRNAIKGTKGHLVCESSNFLARCVLVAESAADSVGYFHSDGYSNRGSGNAKSWRWPQAAGVGHS